MPLVAEKIGWQTKKLGLEKTRIPRCGRRVIVWDELKMKHLALRYGLLTDFSLYPPKPSPRVSVPDGEGSEGGEGFGEGLQELIEPSPEIETKGESGDSGEGLYRDTEEKLGMTIDEAIGIWTKEGKPVVFLGLGENCFNLEKVLKFGRINERHLDVIRKWLEERRN